MYERRHHFVHAFGVLWQDCTCKQPRRARLRRKPRYLYGTTISFTHKMILAYVFGAFSSDHTSWQQIGLLVCHLKWSVAGLL